MGKRNLPHIILFCDMLLIILISFIFLTSILGIYIYIQTRMSKIKDKKQSDIIYVIDLSNHIVEIRSVRVVEKIPDDEDGEMRWKVVVLLNGSSKTIYYDKNLNNPFFEDQRDLVEEFKSNPSSFQNTSVQKKLK